MSPGTYFYTPDYFRSHAYQTVFPRDHSRDGELHMRPLHRPARGDHLRRAPPLLDQDQPAQTDRSRNHCGRTQGLRFRSAGSLYKSHRLRYAAALCHREEAALNWLFLAGERYIFNASIKIRMNSYVAASIQ